MSPKLHPHRRVPVDRSLDVAETAHNNGSKNQQRMKTNSHPVNEESSIQYPGWGVLAAAFTGVMVSFAPIVPYTFSLFLDPLHAAFGWKREALGVAFALAAMTVAFVSPLIGLLLDRYPPRRIILPAICIFAAALASLSTLGPSIWRF